MTIIDEPPVAMASETPLAAMEWRFLDADLKVLWAEKCAEEWPELAPDDAWDRWDGTQQDEWIGGIRGPWQPVTEHRGASRRSESDYATDHQPSDDALAVAADGYRLTDIGNAFRLINEAGGRVRYVREWGRWIVYRCGRWIVDTNDALVTEEAKRVSRVILEMVGQAAGDERERLFRAGIRAESSGACAAMVRLARGIPGVMVDHEELDADPFLLNCINGTVNLMTGELLTHDPDDLCTLQSPVAYDHDAPTSLWMKCLARWQPDPEIRDYLQREMGAGTTGKPTETLTVHHGGGGNGKSKFFGAIQRVLGPYSTEPHKSLIVATRHEQHATVVADLFRVRLAVASETSAAAKLDDEQVKNLTGGDRLRARRMREDPWSFDPSHTLVMFSNHRPEIRGQDEGIWRRVRLVEWSVTIPEAERDEFLSEKLAAEAPGILAWMVEGARRFLAQGLAPPDSVRASTADYRTSEDTVARFLDDARIEFDRHGEIPSSDLMEAHEAWCEGNGFHARSHWQKVAPVLRGQGAKPQRSATRGRSWTGIKVSK